MNENQMLGRVQRTLIVASGELPRRCAALLEECMERRKGPTAATAVVSLNGESKDLETAVAAALNRISPPDLAARLAQAGWQLEQATSIHLFLLLSAEPGGGERAAALAQTVSDHIYRRLGIEALILPVWLVGEGGEEWQSECLDYPQTLPLGNLVLSLCNRDGLRLPDEESLCQVASELLWCLTTAPLLAMIEQRQRATPQAGLPILMSAGVHVWAWSLERTLKIFTRRWLLVVLRQWLIDKADFENLVEVPGWLRTQQITPKNLAAYALREREAALPNLPLAEWQMPWPWEIPALYEKSRFENHIDEEATRAYGKQAQLRLFEPMQRAGESLHEGAYQWLNKQPVAGIAQAAAWINAVLSACDQMLNAVFDWENDLNETAELLAAVRGELEGKMRENLAGYPMRVSEWLNQLWRLWRWPRLLFAYWRLQSRGQQLCQIYEKQAALRRQKIEQQTAYHGLIEILQMARHLGSQIEEIGDMGQHLLRRLTAEAESPDDTEETELPFTWLSVPDKFFARIIRDEKAEATAAAAAVGGLGSQIRQLDDGILDGLRKFGASRLASLGQITAADLLMAQLAEESLETASILQRGWEAACPLWPVDVASLDETSRLNQEMITVFCGANAQLLSDKPALVDDTVFALSTGWRSELWLIRLHLGLERPMQKGVQTKKELQNYESP